jgi:glycosyltransferase involved in cell wall biosynthesis
METEMILWSGPLEDISGYGTASRDYVEGLVEAGIKIYTYPVKYDHLGSNDKFLGNEVVEYFQKTFVGDLTAFIQEYKGGFNHLWHSSPSEARLSKDARKNILMTIWETDKVPEFHKGNGNLLKMDHIITASEFSKAAFLSTYPDLDIRIVPHIIYDRREYKPKMSDKLAERVNKHIKDKFVFLWNAEWHYGKGYDMMLRAFCETFHDNPDVVLVLKTYSLSSTNYKAQVINYIRDIKKEYGYEYPKILPLVGNLSYHDVVALYGVANSFINSSRREGFSLTTAEALSFGLPVIAPSKGGHTEFLNVSNHARVASEWVEVSGVEANRSIYKDQKWVEMDHEDFCTVLKDMFYNYEHFVKFCGPAIDKTLKKFSPENVTATLIKNLE